MKRVLRVGVVLVSLASTVTLIGSRPLLAQRAAVATAAPASAAQYFPDRFDWQHKAPDAVGMDAALLKVAVDAAIAADTPGTHNTPEFLKRSFGNEAPYDALIGPTFDRGPVSGLITRHGYVVAEWGDPARVEVTNSVTKTFLTTVVGLAWQKGLIRDVNDYVRDYMPPGVDLFMAEHNRNIKWDHLLRQTSDWSGTLFGKPDWADRPIGKTPEEWEKRPMYEPGSHFKYNDVRINVLSLAALQVWRRPLPDVLREEIMEPIGASNTWRWLAYDNAWVDLDGHHIQSVPGGGHWGAGMYINSYDLARFGYLFLRGGKWKDRTIVADKWIQMARTPGSDNKTYGFANWYLNTDRKPLPSAPATAVRFVGNGSNIVYVDYDNDIVAVFRWIRNDRALDEVLGKIIASIKPGAATKSTRQ